jgi:hypothetical protein
MDKFEKMYSIQEKFTKEFFDENEGYDISEIPNDKAKRIFWSKDYILMLIKEVTEMLDEIDFKSHKSKTTEDDLDNFLEEGIDVMKYLLGLLIINGFSVDEIYNKFISKSKLVEQKFKQEPNA